VLAHGVHLSEDELCRCHGAARRFPHCPTSNLFLGSGLFHIGAARMRGVRTGRARYRHRRRHQLLAACHDGRAYEIAQLNGHALSAIEAFYLATLGGARRARALRIASARSRPARRPIWWCSTRRRRRCSTCAMRVRESVEDILFALMMLGDDRAVRATYVAGRPAHARDA